MEEDQKATPETPAAPRQPAPEGESEAALGPVRIPAVVPAPIYQVMIEILAFTAGVDEACVEGRWIRPPAQKDQDESAGG